MSIRRIRQLGDPLLRERSLTVTNADETLEDLRDTLHAFQREHGFGRGISAVQIGRLERVVYIEFEGAEHRLINPEFTAMSAQKFILWDDCFSFPNLLVKLERSVSVELRYWDERGDEKVLAASGALSELLQHELDHLDGILAVDRALDGNSLATREEWSRKKILKFVLDN
jgi:peptide deformylase